MRREVITDIQKGKSHLRNKFFSTGEEAMDFTCNKEDSVHI